MGRLKRAKWDVEMLRRNKRLSEQNCRSLFKDERALKEDGERPKSAGFEPR